MSWEERAGSGSSFKTNEYWRERASMRGRHSSALLARSVRSIATLAMLQLLLILAACSTPPRVADQQPTKGPATDVPSPTISQTPVPLLTAKESASTTAESRQAKPTLVDVAVSPAKAMPGDTLLFSFTVSSPSTQSVSLGAGLAPAGSQNFVSDSAHDRTVDVMAGTTVVTRTLVIDMQTSPGVYDAIWGLWSPEFKTQYGRATRNRVVTIGGNAADATITTGSAADAKCQPPALGKAEAARNAELTIDVKVDPAPSGSRISPYIYGVADSGSEHVDHLRDIGAPIVRWGGNARTRHNWEINASNAGSDWEFRNVSQGDTIPGSAGDKFVHRNQEIGAASILTIPTIGWVAKDGNNDTRSTNTPNQGGPPVQPGSDAITGYDPGPNRRVTSLPSIAKKGKPFADPPDLNDGKVYQDEWVNHLVKTFGQAKSGGVPYYALDNEPDLWADDTHVDIHPVRMSYDAMLAMFIEYSSAIKDVDPSAQIMAPEVSGVTSIFYSALDRGDDSYERAPDRQAHGGEPFLSWFLQEIHKHDQQTGHRSLDVLTVHHYPQGGVYPAGDDAQKNALRLRSTQQLWNPNYTDESWINRTEAPQLQLIPRLREWVNNDYPGTKIGITEWNYGNDDHINGGLTVADVLGIFGREGLDVATYWMEPEPGTPGASAFKLYRNYDNCGHHFGDQLLKTTSTDEQTLAAYGSRDSQSGDILVVAINKLPNKAVAGRFDFGNLGNRTVQVYQFDAKQTAIHRVPDLKLANSKLEWTVQPYSATLFVVKP